MPHADTQLRPAAERLHLLLRAGSCSCALHTVCSGQQHLTRKLHLLHLLLHARLQAKLRLTFKEEPLGFNGPFLVHAQLAPADQLGGSSLVQPSQPLRASGCGQSKQMGRQQASAALLELLLQVTVYPKGGSGAVRWSLSVARDK
jgi:hypothetical protein